ncbi:hypothetical protein [Foetidibacter luteolus]|uniref:hypothetical protein n=1 Tax=Foetidibacter luteolus TaxID=2608880 RepID=UPI00129B7002|nr:hypothetical protein [Foetidibacter luteolus]
MKNALLSLLLRLILFLPVTVKAQLSLRLGTYSSSLGNFKDSTVEALKIASFILSTTEFKDSVMKCKFKCSNLPSRAVNSCHSYIEGQRVLDSLFRYNDTLINIFIVPLPRLQRLLDRSPNIGFSSEGGYTITTRTWYLRNGSPGLFVTAKYAAHLIHEYCHIRGYYHISGQQLGKDVAETIGKISGQILRRRISNNEPIK